MRILYIQASWVPPPKNTQTDRFVLLSERLQGDVLHPVWFDRPEQIEAEFGPGAYPEYTRGKFHYHWFLAFRYTGWRRRLETFWFYFRKGWELHRRNHYDCIVVYSHMTPTLVGLVLKLLTRAKLIVEVVTSPHLVYITEHTVPTFRDRAKKLYSDLCLHISLLLTDRAHLLYPEQLTHYRLLRRVKTSVFHDFVPISVIPRYQDSGEAFVLLAGSPWYLKGADVLIEAFRRLAPDFPQVKLKILGHYPDRDQLEALAGGLSQIEILKATPHPVTLGTISRAMAVVLPSRCEGLARVLIEAMSAGVPVICSDTGGNPYIIRHGENGFVVPAGDARALETKLRELLADEHLRRKMGDKGYEMAHTRFTEQVYVDQFTRMVELTLRGSA